MTTVADQLCMFKLISCSDNMLPVYFLAYSVKSCVCLSVSDLLFLITISVLLDALAILNCLSHNTDGCLERFLFAGRQ